MKRLKEKIPQIGVCENPICKKEFELNNNQIFGKRHGRKVFCSRECVNKAQKIIKGIHQT